SWTYEAGLRTQHDGLRLSGTIFYNQLDNYQATAQLDAGTPTTVNIGGVEIYGVELEAGTAPWHNFTFYGSLTLQSSNIDDNIAVNGSGGTVGHARTAGNELTDTPNIILAGSIGYSNGPFFFNINPKYTGERQVSMVNDAQVDGYTTVDATVGYRINDHAVFRVFGTNLLGQEYISEINTNATGTSIAYNARSSTTIENGLLNPGSFFVTPGAPGFVGGSITVDF